MSITADEVSFETGPGTRPSTVVWATGFRADYSWVDVPGVIDVDGRLWHERGITSAPGLAFVGLPGSTRAAPRCLDTSSTMPHG